MSSTAIIECPEHGDLCGGVDCCCADLHVVPTWKDAHDALSVYVSAIVGVSTPDERDEVFRRYTAIREALAEHENGRSTPCSNYTARSWSPGSEQPEDARCVNCNQSHGPAVGGSESRVAPGQLADEERSAPPTDLGLENGRSATRSEAGQS